MPTYTADHVADSRSVGACGVRTCPTKSKISIPTISAIVRAQTKNGTSMRRQASGYWHQSVPEVSPAAGGCLRPAAPEAMGPRDDDAAAGDTPLHVRTPRALHGRLMDTLGDHPAERAAGA